MPSSHRAGRVRHPGRGVAGGSRRSEPALDEAVRPRHHPKKTAGGDQEGVLAGLIRLALVGARLRERSDRDSTRAVRGIQTVTRAYVALFSSISTSEKMAALPNDAARLFFLALLPQCDSYGRIEASPPVLAAKVWPMWGHDPATTQAARDACAAVGLIDVHAKGGRSWIQVPRWDEMAGRIGRLDKRGASGWPDPAEESRIVPGVVGSGPDRSGKVRRGREKSPQSRVEEKGVEEGRGDPPPSEPAAVVSDPQGPQGHS